MQHFLSDPDTALGFGVCVGILIGVFGAFLMRAELTAENRRLRRDNARLNHHPAAADSEPTVDLDRDALLLGTSGIIVPQQRRGL